MLYEHETTSPIFSKCDCQKVRVTLLSFYAYFLRALFETSCETRSGINGLLGIRVIPSHPVCRGFTLEKRAPDKSRSKSNVVYARSGPSAFLPFRMRRRAPRAASGALHRCSFSGQKPRAGQ